MNNFPLTPFLISLTSRGIRPTIRDYERIGLALQSGGPWTISRLRDTLLALLARDEDQQEIFLSCFDQFFQLEPGAEHVFEEIDLEKALADLKQLADEEKESSWIKPNGIDDIIDAKKPIKSGLKLFVIALVILILVVTTIVWRPWAPEFIEQPAVLNPKPNPLEFSNLIFGNDSTAEVIFKNTGWDFLTINNLTISGNDSGHFYLPIDYQPREIAPRDSDKTLVTFKPVSAGNFLAFLNVYSNTRESPQSVMLRGACYETTIQPPPPECYLIYRNVPYVDSVRYEPIQRANTWKIFAGVALFFLISSVLYGIYLYRSRKIPEDEAPEFDEHGPRHFSIGSIGDEPVPRLNEEILAQLADSTGYFLSEDVSKELNVPASIEATGRNGGIPALEFYKRKQVRSLLILEDEFAEARTWNPIARELAEGIKIRGVPVIYGKFKGTPDEFKTASGSVYRLEDLEDQRRGYLVLVFTDGKGLDRHDGTFALEALAHWHRVAWIELREPRAWDETSVLPTKYNIPIYPATPGGLLLAFSKFLTEQSTRDDFSSNAINWQGLPEQAEMSFDCFIELLLGDALSWAQDCALMPTVSIGLADELRQRFHENLPPERIERLFALPGTDKNVSGLRFSDEVLKVLRNGFFARRDDNEQVTVLKFLLKKIKEAEPAIESGKKENLAHQAWEAIKERVILELDPDNDLKQFARLAKGPLAGYIEGSLENFGFPEQEDKIPLRVKPTNKNALQRLTRIN